MLQEVRVALESDASPIGADDRVQTAAVRERGCGDPGELQSRRVVQPDLELIVGDALAQEVGITLKHDLGSIGVDAGLVAFPANFRSSRDSSERHRRRVEQPDLELTGEDALPEEVGVALEDDVCSVRIQAGAEADPTRVRGRRKAGEVQRPRVVQPQFKLTAWKTLGQEVRVAGKDDALPIRTYVRLSAGPIRAGEGGDPDLNQPSFGRCETSDEDDQGQRCAQRAQHQFASVLSHVSAFAGSYRAPTVDPKTDRPSPNGKSS